MKFGHIFIPLTAHMTWNMNDCLAAANFGDAQFVSLDEPKQIECPLGKHVMTVSFNAFSAKADPALVSNLPSHHLFLSASFYE